MPDDRNRRPGWLGAPRPQDEPDDRGPRLSQHYPCGDACDGARGDDVDPDYYCRAGKPWSEHDERY